MDIPALPVAGLPVEETVWLHHEARRERVQAGTVIARHGAPCPGLLLVEDALLARMTPRGSLPPHEFGLDGPGSIALPFAVIGNGFSPWDLVVRRSGEVWRVDPTRLGDLPGQLKRLAEEAAAMQTAALVRHTGLCSRRSARSLVAARLQDYFATLGEDRLAITHDQMAERMALRRATVTIALQELEGLHAIRARRGVIELADAALLAAECGW